MWRDLRVQEWVPVCWALQAYGDHRLHSLGGLQVARRGEVGI